MGGAGDAPFARGRVATAGAIGARAAGNNVTPVEVSGKAGSAEPLSGCTNKMALKKGLRNANREAVLKSILDYQKLYENPEYKPYTLGPSRRRVRQPYNTRSQLPVE